MIYSYKYLPHDIELLHEHIAYFFRQLFRYAPKKYDENLLLRPEFLPLVKKDRANLRYVLEDELKQITELFFKLSRGEQERLEIAFSYNNSIECLCNGELEPVRYDELDKTIRDVLDEFFVRLWNVYIKRKPIEEKFGSVQDYFDAFMDSDHQIAYVCPFCGIYPLKPSGGKYRDDYDHYLPKSIYPFTAVNFKNLVPMCKACNMDAKNTADTLVNEKGERRRVFYPLAGSMDGSKLKVSIKPEESYNPINYGTLLTTIKWKYDISLAGGHDERLESWNDIFDIKRRYKDLILNFQGEWFREIKNRYIRERRMGITFNSFKEGILEDTKYTILNSGMGIIKFAYFNFLLSDSNFEQYLSDYIH